MTENLATLIRRRGPIRRIGVIGMGYAGIPAAALFRVYAARWISLQDCDAQPWGVAAQG